MIVSSDFVLLRDIDNAVERDISRQARQEYMNICLTIIRAHPFFGIGAGNYPIVSGSYAPHNYSDTAGLEAGVHNVYLHIAMEAGIAAMCSFIIFLLLHIRLLIHLLTGIRDQFLARFSKALLLSLGIGTIYILFDILPHTLVEWYFGITLGLVIVLKNLAKGDVRYG